MAFTAYRMASAGEPVKVVDDSREDWLQIEPPKDLSVWVSAQYIHMPPENAAKLAAKPPAEPAAPGQIAEKLPPAPKKPEPTPPPKPSNTDVLPFTDDKAMTVSVDGTVLPLKDQAYFTHAVAVKVAGEFFPLCYIRSDKHDLKPFERMHVNVIGKQRWVRNWKRPVVEVEKIRATE